jgi:hypothetical protein
MLDHIKDFKPKSNADPTQLKGAKDYAISEINALPPEFNFVRVTIEANNNGSARQTMVMVIPQSVIA